MIPMVLAGERFWQEPSKGGTKSDFLILVKHVAFLLPWLKCTGLIIYDYNI